jgi:integrase
MPKATKFPKGIRPQANGSWKVDVTINGVRKTGTAKTLEEAKVLRERLKAALEAGKDTSKVISSDSSTNSWNLETAVKRTYDLVWSKGKSADKTMVYAKQVRDYFGPLTKLDQITMDDIDNFCDYCADTKGNSGATINRKLSALSVMMTTALTRGKLGKLKQVPKMPRWPESEHRIRFLTEDEEARILELMGYLGKESHKDATIVLVDTGLRPSELWRAEAKDFNSNYDGDKGAITIWVTKTGAPRTVPLTTRAKEILAQRVEANPTGKLFPDINQDSYRRVWNRVKHLMGLDNDDQFVPYVLRHTCCSRLVQRRAPLEHVRVWMGHSVIQTTLRYAHLAPESLSGLTVLLEKQEEARCKASGF